MKKSIKLFTSRVCFALIAAFLLGGVLSASSASRTWKGANATDGAWSRASNWVEGAAPGTGNHNVFFTSTCGNWPSPWVNQVSIINNLTYNSGACQFNVIDNNSSVTLTINGDIINNGANAQTISVRSIIFGSTRTVNTASGNIIISGGISGSGFGLTKSGSYVLVLSGTNTYSGATTVGAGKLLGKSGGSISNSVVTVTATTATNGVQIATPGGQFTCAGLTYSAAGALAFDFNNGVVPDGATAPLQVNGDLAFAATPAVTILGDSVPATTASYPLISYTGTASGTPPTAVTITPPLAGGASAAVRLDSTGKVLYLDVTAGVTPTKLVYTSVPASPQQGLPFSVTVQSQDAGGTAGNVTNDTTVTLSVGSGSGSLSGTISGVMSNGQNSLTIAGVIYSAADTMTLTATPTAGMTTLTPATSGSIAFASEPTKLAYTLIPTIEVAGRPFNVTVQAQDSGGSPRGVTTDTTITLSRASGSGALGGTTSGIISNGQNSVTISGVTYDTVEAMTMTASATAGMSLTAITSGSITFTPDTQTLHWGPNDANWTDTGAWYNIGTSSAATYNDVAPDAVVLEDTNSGTGDRTITLSTTVSPASITVTADAKNFTISGPGVIDGNAGLSKDGASALTLGTSNTFRGDTRIVDGTLVLGHTSALGGSTLDMNTSDSGTLSFDSVTAAALGGLRGGRGIVLTNASGAAVTLTVGNNNSNTTYLGVLSGTGGFTKTGTGTFTWGDETNAPMTYSGNTVINQGTAVIVTTNLLPYGSGKGDVTLNGTLNIVDMNLNGLNGSGTINMTTAGGATLTIGNNDASASFSGRIQRGTGVTQNTLIKVGAGTQTFSADNAIGNATGWGVFINGGKIIAANAGAVGSYACTVNAGSTLEIANLALSAQLRVYLNNGATLLAGGGTSSAFGSATRDVTIGAGAAVTIATAASTDSLTCNSVIVGGDAASVVTSVGPGTLVLATGSGSSAYAGKWKLTGGTLRLSNGNALGNSTTKAIELAGGTLETTVSGDATYSTATTVSSSSSIRPNQAAGGASHAFGTLLINNSTLSISPGAQITGGTETNTFGATTLTGSPTFDVANSGTAIMAVVLGAVGESGGARALTKQGTGTLVISGVSTYSGGTTIAGGTLEIGASGSIKGNVTVTGSMLKLDNAAALESTATLTLPASPAADTVSLSFAGTQTISALYFGAAQQAAGTWGAIGSGALHEDAAFAGTGLLVIPAPSSTALASSADPAVFGSLVLTATVTGGLGTPTGTVTFKQGANVLGTAPLAAGVANFNPGNALPPGGPYLLTAEYSGDASYIPSTSSALPQTVTTGELTIKADDKVKNYGTTVALTFTPIGLVAGDTVGSATLTCSEAADTNAVPGSYVIVPSAATGGTFNPANYSITYSNGTLTVIKATLTISGLAAQNKVYDGGTAATLSGTAGLSGVVGSDDVSLAGTASGAFVDANIGTGKTVNVSGLSLTGADAGKYDLAALTLTADITAASTTTALLSSANPSAPGSNVTFTATVSSAAGIPGGNVVFKANTVPFSTNALVSGSAAASTSSLPLGTNAITTEYAAQGNYLGSSASVDQVVKVLVTCSATNALVGIANNLDGTLTLTFVGTPQAEYYVLSSADVGALMTSWSPVPGSTNTVTDPGGVWQATVTNTAPAQFYRGAAVVPCP